MRKLFDRLKNVEDAFSLVELIVAITIIAIMSGVLLRFFVVAATGEQISKTADYNVSVGQDIIDSFKRIETLDSFYNTLNGGLNVSRTPIATGEIYQAYFSQDWTYTTVDNANVRYRMLIEVTKPLANDQINTLDFGPEVDFTHSFISAGSVTLTINGTGSEYQMKITGESDQSLTFAANKDIVTVGIRLPNATAGTLNLINELAGLASGTTNYETFKDDILKVYIQRGTGNTDTIVTSGNVIVVDQPMTESDQLGIYKVNVKFFDLNKSDQLIEEFEGSKYGGSK